MTALRATIQAVLIIFAAAVLLAFGVIYFAGIVKAEPLTVKGAAALLSPSVFELKKDGKFHCTASLIGPRQALTARHCVSDATSKYVIERESQKFYPRSVLTSLQDGSPRDGLEDWAILNLATPAASVPTLTLGCSDDVYVGLPVAYFGHPAPFKSIFRVGYVTSLETRTALPGGRKLPFDVQTSLQVSGGGSGSAVLNLETGRVIGVMTHFTAAPRSGSGTLFGSGFQAITGTDFCEDAHETDAQRLHGEPLASPF